MFVVENGNKDCLGGAIEESHIDANIQSRLDEITGRITNELETLGYEIARLDNDRVACSLFILATDIEKRLRYLGERSKTFSAA